MTATPRRALLGKKSWILKLLCNCSNLINLSNVTELFRNSICRDGFKVQTEEKKSNRHVITFSTKTYSLVIWRCCFARNVRAKALLSLITLIVFVLFSLPSQSKLLKPLNNTDRTVDILDESGVWYQALDHHWGDHWIFEELFSVTIVNAASLKHEADDRH